MGRMPPTHCPGLAHVSPQVCTFESLHEVATGSKRHCGEQQSPGSVLPSSHCSGAVMSPSPQTIRGVSVIVGVVVDVIDGVIVGVPVGVRVTLGVGVDVGVAVGIAVGVALGVLVGVGV